MGTGLKVETGVQVPPAAGKARVSAGQQGLGAQPRTHP